MRINSNRLSFVIAVAATLAVRPVVAQRMPEPPLGIGRAARDVRLPSSMSPVAVGGDRLLLANAERGAVMPTSLTCTSAGGACGRSVAKHAFAGTAAGAGVALLYAFGVCLPRAFAPERRGCSGAVPVVAVGSGALVGLISGLASRHCRGGE